MGTFKSSFDSAQGFFDSAQGFDVQDPLCK